MKIKHWLCKYYSEEDLQHIFVKDTGWSIDMVPSDIKEVYQTYKEDIWDALRSWEIRSVWAHGDNECVCEIRSVNILTFLMNRFDSIKQEIITCESDLLKVIVQSAIVLLTRTYIYANYTDQQIDKFVDNILFKERNNE